MKQLNMKKLVLLNLPYFLLGLFATNLGEAWRLAVGADASAKLLSFFLHPAGGRWGVGGPACTRWIWLWVCAAALACGWRCT